ncbi:hypothetical protein HDV04_001431 [Boothiomyces sp. JEL0838]|nr:hypothetical protein HDV04_001431 [Boothiomyces sp. JEL0838]
MIGFCIYKLYHITQFALAVRSQVISEMIVDYESRRLVMLSDTEYLGKHSYHMFEYRKEDYAIEEIAESILEFLFSEKFHSAQTLRNHPQVRDVMAIFMGTDAKVRIQQLSHSIVMFCEAKSTSHLEKLSDMIVSKYPEKKSVREQTRGCPWIVFDFKVLLVNLTSANDSISGCDIPKCESPIEMRKVERVLSDATLCQTRPPLNVLSHFSASISVDEIDDIPSGTTCTPRSTLTPVRKRVHFCESVVGNSEHSEQDEVQSEGTLDQSPVIKPSYSRNSSESSNETLAEEELYEPDLPPLPPRPKAQVWYMTKKFTAIDPALKAGEATDYSPCTSNTVDPDHIEVTPKESQIHIPHVNTVTSEDNPLNEMPYLLSLPFRAAEATFDVATDMAASTIKTLVIKPVKFATFPVRWISRKTFCKF